MPSLELGLHLPSLTLSDLAAGFGQEAWWGYAGVIFSMGLFNVVGSLQNLESAEAAGDRFEERSSMMVNGLGTVAGSLFGSCFPTTIYIGHPGWKAIGARSSYSTLNAVVCTLICCTGLLSFLVWLIPLEAGMAVVIYIGIVISAQAFEAVDKKHYPAVVMGLLPGLGAWGILMAKNGYRVAGGVFDESMMGKFAMADLAIAGGLAMEQGFILLAMILAACTVALIDLKFMAAAIWMAAASLLSALGLMHGYVLNGGDSAFAMEPAWPFVRAYAYLAVIFLLANFWAKGKPESVGH